MSRLEAEVARHQHLDANRRPPYSIRVGARRFRTAERILEERKQLTSFNFNIELAPQTSSVKEQLIAIRDHAEACLRTPRVLSDSREFAKYRLEQVWAEMKLDGVKKRALRSLVSSLADRLYLRCGDWLLHILGTNEQGRPVRRYEDMMHSLEAPLIQPVATKPRV